MNHFVFTTNDKNYIFFCEIFVSSKSKIVPTPDAGKVCEREKWIICFCTWWKMVWWGKTQSLVKLGNVWKQNLKHLAKKQKQENTSAWKQTFEPSLKGLQPLLSTFWQGRENSVVLQSVFILKVNWWLYFYIVCNAWHFLPYFTLCPSTGV